MGGDLAARSPSIGLEAPSASERWVPGSTQSLPLAPVPSASTRSFGPRARSMGFAARSPGSGAVAQGLAERQVRRFSLVGLVWDNPDIELHGRVQVRTRATGTTTWSAWQDLDTHNFEHAADAGSAERATGRVRGSTAPLWVGDSDGVEARVSPEPEADGHDAEHDAEHGTALPEGMRLELVDPGDESPSRQTPADEPQPAPATDEHPQEGARTDELPAEDAVDPLGAPSAPSAPSAPRAPRATSATSPRSAADAPGSRGALGASSAAPAGAKPYIGPRPRIITRKGWRADEKLREREFLYTKTVQAAFVHHTATGNNYRCSQAPSVIRSIYRYHVKSNRWRDIGYNFVVDKCGNIYEGRAGGVEKPVMGAHTLGFNTNSMGIAVLGTFTKSKPSAAAVRAVARLTAWKLGLFGANPWGSTTLTSGGSNKYKKGRKVRLRVISGHRDGFLTECPGAALYRQLNGLRVASARYQGR
ncbi:peptidoglycan recognition protein family protein [Streptomyces himalayensis]|uniref:peptidoglycan recognition protein family protein n=1 Tax=Streptomyces himalayensis TaxID=2820085 RepID=UPI0035E45021